MTQSNPHATTATLQSTYTRKKTWGMPTIITSAIAVACVATYFIIFAANTVSTDNAYVGAETAQITSMVSGQVAEVLVKDTQQVKKGDVLVRLDERDAKIQLAQAQAELAKAQRQYKQSQANSSSLNSQVVVRNDEITSAQAQVTKAQADFDKANLESDFQSCRNGIRNKLNIEHGDYQTSVHAAESDVIRMLSVLEALLWH